MGTPYSCIERALAAFRFRPFRHSCDIPAKKRGKSSVNPTERTCFRSNVGAPVPPTKNKTLELIMRGRGARSRKTRSPTSELEIPVRVNRSGRRVMRINELRGFEQDDAVVSDDELSRQIGVPLLHPILRLREADVKSLSTTFTTILKLRARAGQESGSR
jgi:hypothetical protein